MSDLQRALEAAIRIGEFKDKALIDSAMTVRDLQKAITQGIEAIERKSYETARVVLKRALDELP